jgi:hypothetical protein
MSTPSNPVLAPSQYHGVIHYSTGYCFLEIHNQPEWALLMYDPSHNQPFDANIAAGTMAKMAQQYQEGDSATLAGIMLEQEALGEKRPVLHLG